MRKFVVALVLAPVIGAALAAPAVFARSTIGRYPAYTLTKDDLALMRSADRDQMDGKPDGTTNSWQNAKSGNSGSAMLVKTSVVNGEPCRRVRHSILPKGKTTPISYLINLCRQSDGDWKLVP